MDCKIKNKVRRKDAVALHALQFYREQNHLGRYASHFLRKGLRTHSHCRTMVCVYGFSHGRIAMFVLKLFQNNHKTKMFLRNEAARSK